LRAAKDFFSINADGTTQDKAQMTAVSVSVIPARFPRQIELTLREALSMNNKLIYWIPVVGVFVSLVNYDKDNGMSTFWNFYQAVVIMILIAIMTLISF